MLLKKVNGKQPTFGESYFFAENAILTDDVQLGDHCTVWYNAVVRGDVNSIHIGNNTGIQDGVVIHATYQTHPIAIGNNVSIGHNAIVHGRTVEDNILIGMSSIVMDGCVVKSDSIITTGAIMPPNTHVERSSLYTGVSTKKLKDTAEAQKALIRRTTTNYPKYASWVDKEENTKD